ncbi:hypothetical protein M9H77_24494 [Catharanthus roseus]|uniref:Uncharacterized protein n=1 Tax=Catharanthus roseus TaxID=4058 RepID=A0ACC0AWN1_CATRO|nr:hypothetical protein M9H77_24494 [Catharanthus roseus]
MQSIGEESVRAKMAELRLICDREIPIQQQRIDTSCGSFRNSLQSAKSKVEQTLELQVKLGKLKAELREAEDGLVKALAVKTRKEAKRMATMESLSATKARLEELKRVVEDKRLKKDEYALILSQQSNDLTELEEKYHQNAEHRKEIEEAMSWYNRVLGFRVECGHGVKFIFTNINLKNPDEEYSFTIRHANDVYTLLDCDPHLNDMKELINELNRSNGLFKFVRTMRLKFQEAAGCGSFPQLLSNSQDYDTITISAPVSSISTDGSESPVKQKESRPADTISVSVPVSSVSTERSESPAKKNRKATGKEGRPSKLFPVSAVRHSPRFKVKK